MTAIAPIAAYLLYLTISIPNSHFCTPDDRNSLTDVDDCMAVPVCALYSGNDENSVSGFYQKTLPNSETACKDVHVIAYTFGECQGNPIQVCSSNSLSTDTSSSDSDSKVCSFSEKRRLGGKTQEVLLTSLDASKVCQNTNNAFYIMEDCATIELHERAICTADKRAKKQDFLIEKRLLSEESQCVYFTGENCKGLKVCRRTEQITDSLCSNEDILFYTEGPCDDVNIEEIDPHPASVSDLRDDIPEIGVETETLPDGSVLVTPIGEVKAPEGEVVNSIVQTDEELGDTPELEAETMPDGSVKLTPKNPRIPSQEPKQDEIDPDAVLDLSNDVPEVEAETLADGTIVMTPVGEILPPEGGVVQHLRNSEDEPLDLSNDVPEVEAETLPDGTVVMTPVVPLSEQVLPGEVLDLGDDIPEVKTETMADGSVVMTPVVPLSEEALPGEVQDLGDDVPEVKEEAVVEGGIVMTPEGEQPAEPIETMEATTTTTTTSTTTSTTTTKTTTTSTSHATGALSGEEPKGLKVPEKVLKAVEFVIANNAGGLIGRSAQELGPEVEPSN